MKGIKWLLTVLLGVLLFSTMGIRMAEQQRELESYQAQTKEHRMKMIRLQSRVNAVEKERRFVCTNVAKAVITLENK